MKKLILGTLLCLSFLGFSQDIINVQTKDFISKSEIVMTDGKFHIEKKIILDNGENEPMKVKFDFFGSDSIADFDFTKIDKMVFVASENAKYKLKSPSTYRPYSIVISNTSDNLWYTNVFYSGENSFGAKKDTSSMAEIDNEGQIVKNY